MLVLRPSTSTNCDGPNSKLLPSPKRYTPGGEVGIFELSQVSRSRDGLDPTISISNWMDLLSWYVWHWDYFYCRTVQFNWLFYRSRWRSLVCKLTFNQSQSISEEKDTPNSWLNILTQESKWMGEKGPPPDPGLKNHHYIYMMGKQIFSKHLNGASWDHRAIPLALLRTERGRPWLWISLATSATH